MKTNLLNKWFSSLHCTNYTIRCPGNYYALKGEHERAIAYFQRALKLNNRYQSDETSKYGNAIQD